MILPDLPNQRILELKEEEKYTSIVAQSSSAKAVAQFCILLVTLANIMI